MALTGVSPSKSGQVRVRCLPIIAGSDVELLPRRFRLVKFKRVWDFRES